VDVAGVRADDAGEKREKVEASLYSTFGVFKLSVIIRCPFQVIIFMGPQFKVFRWPVNLGPK